MAAAALRALRQHLQLIQAAIKLIRVATPLTRIVILPNSLVSPTARNRTGNAIPAGEIQRTRTCKRARAASARLPPAAVGIQDRVPRCCGMVCVYKVLDPDDHGGG